MYPPELFISQGCGARIRQSGLRENQILSRRLEQYDQFLIIIWPLQGVPCVCLLEFSFAESFRREAIDFSEQEWMGISPCNHKNYLKCGRKLWSFKIILKR